MSQEKAKRTVVLIVDDEQGMRDMLSWYLSQREYQVHVAADGKEAADFLDRELVDLVISDVSMPRLNGLELLDAAGRTKPGPAFILMTGFGAVETAVHAMRRGASDFLLKPFNLEHLMLRVAEVTSEGASTGMPS